LGGLALNGLLVVLALFLVALNGLFVAAEFAFVKIRATQVERLVQEGKATARLVKDATRRLDAYLSVCQLGITISSLGLGWIGEPAFAHILKPILEPLGIPEGSVHIIAFVLAFGTITFLHVVFGELAPKSVAIANAEGTSLFVAPFMRFFYYLFLPGIYVFNGTANAVVRLFGVPAASETEETHSEEEVRIIIEQAARRGILDPDEKDMLEAVFEMEERRAREVMIPRPDVVSLPASMPLTDLFSMTAEGKHTRYPVHEDDSFERIVGAVHIRDVMNAVADKGLQAPITARELAREVLVVPENRPIDEILKDLQKQEVQIAIVIDEWGSFEGLITIEDIIEEIVGEIRDEFDEEAPTIRKLPDGSYLIDGSASIGVVNEALDSQLESEDFDTIGGLVFGVIGRAPKVGDEVHLDGYLICVEEVEGQRIAQVVARKEST
jgi:CBS domain containing-hemolysin-like protein